jgi:hypothetical protein
MNEFYTQRGDRPDLAARAKLTQASVGGYAFTKLFPVFPVTERAGDFSYAPVGQTNVVTNVAEARANGAALTATDIATADFAWTTARLEARTRIFANEVKGFGGIEAADAFGGEDCVRRAYNKVEIAAYAKAFSSARRTAKVDLANHEVVTLLQKGSLAQRKYGAPYLVMTTYGLLKFVNIPEVRSRMFGEFGPTGAMNYLTGGQAQLAKAISPLIGFEDIVLFDSEIVGSTYDDYVAVASLRKEAMAGGATLSGVAKARALYGFSALYIPDPASNDQPFSVSSFDDRLNKANLYDAESRYSLNELHADAVTVYAMLADIASYTPIDSRVLQVQVVNTEDAPVVTNDIG